MRKRILNIADCKYKFKEDYQGFDIYSHITQDGIEIHNEWLLHYEPRISKSDINIVIYSYNNICFEELFDAIDNYVNNGLLGFKAFEKNGYTVVHPNGNEIL